MFVSNFYIHRIETLLQQDASPEMARGRQYALDNELNYPNATLSRVYTR